MKFYKKDLNGIVLMLTFCLSVISCKKFVQVNPPVTQLVSASVFNDNSTANAAQTVIYSQMASVSTALSYFIPLYTGLSSDELSNFSTVPELAQFYTNTLSPTNSQINSLWSIPYNFIYEANAIIDGLKNSKGVNAQVKQQLTGESEFIRAFWNFYLVNLFGDIPLINTTDYKISSTMSRTAVSQVYDQIINDLKDAQNLLNDKYVGSDGVTVTDERVRPNKWTATALLARAYLFEKDYANAEAQATLLINNSEFTLVDLYNVFLANSNEAIWQLMVPLPNTINTVEGYYFILTDIPQSNIFNCATISNQLLSSFELGDNRKISWIGSVTSETDTFYFPYKYKVYASSDVTEYSMVFRIAEQFLIRAEARAQQNDILGAVADLNAIRNRAGLPNTTVSTQSELLEAILHEKQVELFCEWGHRWLDLKRTGNVDEVMSATAPLKNGVWNTNSQVYPIPQTELSNDPNLIQNPGY